MFKQLVIAICAQVKYSMDDQSMENFLICWTAKDLLKDAAKNKWWE